MSANTAEFKVVRVNMRLASALMERIKEKTGYKPVFQDLVEQSLKTTLENLEHNNAPVKKKSVGK